MAAALGSLVVTLGLDAAKFTAGLTKAEYEAKKWRESTLKAAREVGAVLGTSAVAAAGGLALMTRSAIDSADSLNKLTQKTGETAEVLSGLQYAFELGDVAGDEFATSMGRLAKSISEAAQGGGEQVEAFKALGIAVKNADGSLRPVSAVLADLATRFAGLADGPEKTALAVTLLGKSGANLIPTLNAGSAGLSAMADEAQRLGLVIDTETARAAEEFNDTITKLGKSTDAVGIRMARELLPALQAAATGMLEAANEGGPLAGTLDTLAGAARGAVEALVVLGANVAFVFKGVGREIGAIAAQMVSLASGDLKGFNAISEAVKEDAKRARAELDAFERRVLGTQTAASYSNEGRNYSAREGAKPPAPRAGGAGKGKGATAAETEAQRYLEALQKQVEGLRTQGAEEKALADIQAKRIAGITPALEKQILAQARLIDQGREARALEEAAAQGRQAAAALATRATEEAAREVEAIAESNAALRDEIAILQGGENARRAIEQARLSSAIALKEETLAQYQNAEAKAEDIQALQQQLALLRERANLLGARNSAEDLAASVPQKEQVKETSNAAEELGMTFASAFEDAIVSGNSLRSVLKGLGEDILRLTTREMVTKPLAGMFTNWLQGLGTGGNSYAGASEFADFAGNAFGARATGGAVEAGGLYRVNERRTPEMLDVNGRQFLLMGNQRGRVHPNPQVRGGRGGVSAPITINMPAGTSAQTAQQVAAVVSRHLMRATARAA